MFRTKLIATAGAVAAAAACTLFAAPAATAAPSPTCGTCWTPRSVPMTAPDLGAAVGSAVLRVSL